MPRPIETPDGTIRALRWIALPGCDVERAEPIVQVETKTDFVWVKAEAKGILSPTFVENGQAVLGNVTIGFLLEPTDDRTSDPSTLTLRDTLKQIGDGESWKQLCSQLQRGRLFGRCAHYFLGPPNKKISRVEQLVVERLADRDHPRPPALSEGNQSPSPHWADKPYVDEIKRGQPGVPLHPEFWCEAKRWAENQHADFVWSLAQSLVPRSSSFDPGMNHYAFGIVFSREDVERIWPLPLDSSFPTAVFSEATAVADPVHTVSIEIKPLKDAAREFGVHPDTVRSHGVPAGWVRKSSGRWVVEMGSGRSWRRGQRAG